MQNYDSNSIYHFPKCPTKGEQKKCDKVIHKILLSNKKGQVIKKNKSQRHYAKQRGRKNVAINSMKKFGGDVRVLSPD